jgi:hypothetical protein
VLYEVLSASKPQGEHVYDTARRLWREYLATLEPSHRAWALSLDALETHESETILDADSMDQDSIPDSISRLLEANEVEDEDLICLCIAQRAHALLRATSSGPGDYAWDQLQRWASPRALEKPVEGMRKLSRDERVELTADAETKSKACSQDSGPSYWKLAPGRRAHRWQDWLQRGVATIGWPLLGDLSDCDEDEFERRFERLREEHSYTIGSRQALRFRQIQPGDRIVANEGKSKILGIGTVTSGYRFVPDAETTQHEENFAHQLEVHWDDTRARTIPEEGGWQRALLELDADKFESLLSPTDVDSSPGSSKEPSGTHTPLRALPCHPQNIILYGPPGTGKTYSTVRRALELALGADRLTGLSESAVQTLFRQQQADGRIEFVTFHQAYGYEEFVEGIRPILGQGSNEEVRYELHEGAFKRIAMRAAAAGLREVTREADFDQLWGRFLAQLAARPDQVFESQGGKSYILERTSNDNLRALLSVEEGSPTSDAKPSIPLFASKETLRVYWQNRKQLGPEPAKLTHSNATKTLSQARGGGGGHHYTACWIVYSQLYHLSREKSAHAAQQDRRIALQRALDHPSPESPLKFDSNSPQYVLIIDEINRGNISKILGELITLLEPDKRLGSRTELRLPLSYSPQHRFGVPPNLHVIGTMNTADRSIALMDIALRRRFRFEELRPDVETLRSVLRQHHTSPVFVELVADLFETLNSRIRVLYDEDHQLGHAFFLGVRDARDLVQVFADRVIPMLQEYFYGAWSKICAVLGCPYAEDGSPTRRAAHLLIEGESSRYRAALIHALHRPGEDFLSNDDFEALPELNYIPDTGLREPARMSSAQIAEMLLGVLHLTGEEDSTRRDALLASPEFGGSTSAGATTDTEAEPRT